MTDDETPSPEDTPTGHEDDAQPVLGGEVHPGPLGPADLSPSVRKGPEELRPSIETPPERDARSVDISGDDSSTEG